MAFSLPYCIVSDTISAGIAYDGRDVARLRASDLYADAFLRARKGVVEDAADMCNSTFAWRKNIGLNGRSFVRGRK